MTNEDDSIQSNVEDLLAPVEAPIEAPAQSQSAPWLAPHRWQPGQSGNPSGRPRESGSLSAALRRVGIMLYLSNYTTIQLKDAIARIEGVGDAIVMGQQDYSMRIWLDPDKLQARNMTVGDVVRVLREQNVQVAAGRIGQPPVPAGQDFQLTLSTLGRLTENCPSRKSKRRRRTFVVSTSAGSSVPTSLLLPESDTKTKFLTAPATNSDL